MTDHDRKWLDDLASMLEDEVRFGDQDGNEPGAFLWIEIPDPMVRIIVDRLRQISYYG